jgi:hypothetical protein
VHSRHFFWHATKDILRLGMPSSLICCAQAEFPAHNVKGIAELAIEPGANGRLIVLVELLPIERVENLDEGVERLSLLLDAVKEGLGFMDFGDVNVSTKGPTALSMISATRLSGV